MFKIPTLKGKSLAQLDGDIIRNALNDSYGMNLPLDSVYVLERRGCVQVKMDRHSEKAVHLLLQKHEATFALYFDGETYIFYFDHK